LSPFGNSPIVAIKDVQMRAPAELYQKLTRYGQQHLLGFWDLLTEQQRVELCAEIAQVDFEAIAGCLRNQTEQNPWSVLSRAAEPPPTANGQLVSDASLDEARAAGRGALAKGQIGVVLVAGGQGTRLGFDHPKGMLPVGPVSGRTLFEILIDLVRARADLHGCRIPVVVMTSLATHDATVRYFADHDRLGLNAEDLEIVCQGNMPAVDRESGKILLAEPHRLALSPDGHGGLLQALEHHGTLARLGSRGIRHLFYAQIDNPLAQICDPLTIGFHTLRNSEMTTQVVRKTDPLQRVGNVVLLDNRVQVIEYSDLPEQVARQRAPDGSLRLWAGNIAVHVISVAFLERVAQRGPPLPFHLAVKRVPYVDANGRSQEPREPNAIKFERFIFDLLPSAQNAMVVEIDPAEGFAPVKNGLDVSTENPHTAQAAMTLQHARRWRAFGGQIHAGAVLELHPLVALDTRRLQDWIRRLPVCAASTYLQP
jgi:UDP-N-acetylglucosamine/UDP-N-acetylgalactosamine diphosphorylase